MLTPELQSQQTNLQYEQQSDLEESSVASETESTLETTSLVKEAEISESADSKNHLIEDSATSQSELDPKSLEKTYQKMNNLKI